MNTPKRGCETILVAEDDEILRKLAVTLLGEFGYTVIAAEDGYDAIEKFRTHRDGVQLVILDMIMPGKNGKETYDAIKALRSDIKVLFSSGYSKDIVHKKDMLDDHLDFVMKPIAPVDLLNKIREMLDR